MIENTTFIGASGGGIAFMPVTSVDELRSLQTAKDKLITILVSNNTNIIYQWNASSVALDDGSTVISSNSTVTGRWLMEPSVGIPETGLIATNVIILTTSGVIGNPSIGGTTVINSSAATVQTLPNTSMLKLGNRIELLNTGNGIAAITAFTGQYIQCGQVSLTSLSLGAGDSLTLEYNGTGVWLAVGGTASLKYSSGFASSVTASGSWEMSPSGIITQTGIFLSKTSGDTAVTFPIAFPNACFGVYVSAQCTTGLNSPGYNAQTKTGFNGNAWSSIDTRVITNVYYIAKGN